MHRTRWLGLIGITSLAACGSFDPATVIRDLPPAALTVAVDDFGALPTEVDDVELHLAADAAQLRDLLARSLREADAASRVVLLSDLADGKSADVVLKARLSAPVEFTHRGLSSGVLASAGLWLFTWIGGLAVDDSTYTARMILDCSFENPNTGRAVEHEARSTSVDLSFLERNDFFSWSTAQALILPPFLTSDQTRSTSEALTLQATQTVAADLAKFLKQDYEDAVLLNDYYRVGIASPENGAEVMGDSVELDATITAIGQYEVSAVVVSVNGVEQERLEPENVQDPFGGKYVAKIDAVIQGLQLGENFVRLRIIAAQEYTRTLRIVRVAGS